MRKYFSLFLFAIVCAFSHSSVAQKKEGQALVDHLLSKISKSSSDTSKVSLLNDLSNAYFDIDIEKGMIYAKQANEQAKKIKWESGIAYSNLNTTSYSILKTDYASALKKGKTTLNQFQKLNDNKGIALTHLRIGKAQMLQGSYPNALSSCFEALSIFEKLNDQKGIAETYSTIARIYSYQGDHDEAIDFAFKSLKINQNIGYLSGKAMSLNTIGNCYYNKKEYSKSLEYWKQSLALNQELGNKHKSDVEIDNIGWSYYKLSNFPLALKYLHESLILSKKNGGETLAWDYVGIGGAYLAIAKENNQKSLKDIFKGNKTAALEQAKSYTDSAIIISESNEHLQSLMEGYKQLSEIQSLLGDHEAALTSFKKYIQKANDVYGKETSSNITSIKMKHDQEKIDAKNKAEMEKQKLFRNLIFTGLIIALLFLIVIYRQRNRITKEKDRSENLLLNILPADIAEELKTHGKAEARDFDKVTIIFTDFKDFTKTSEKLSAKELVSEINACFEAFDLICTKYNVEKIKTIGDAYMAAGGLLESNQDSLKNTILAAIEMQAFISKRKIENDGIGKPAFQMRAGIHTGPVVAGIVGVKKFQYDIWGDTVNTASRIESNGEVGKVNISQATFELIKNDADFIFESRGKIEAKGKGEIEMWFVECNYPTS